MNDSLQNIIDSSALLSFDNVKDTVYVINVKTNVEFIDLLPLIIAFFAIVLSLITTIISKKSLNENKLHQRLSVVPAINYFEDFTLRPNSEGVGLLVKNVGLGPALIKKFELSWNDIKIESQEDFSKVPKEKLYGAFEGNHFSANSILNNNTSQWIIRIPLNFILSSNGSVDIEKFNNVREQITNNVKLIIIYRSFYDEEEYQYVMKYPTSNT